MNRARRRKTRRRNEERRGGGGGLRVRSRAADSPSLEIHACASAEKGDELFNTFGQQNNASLLHKYGFCELRNAYTNV